MKKIIIALLIVATMLSFVGCGNETAGVDDIRPFTEQIEEFRTNLNNVARKNNLKFIVEESKIENGYTNKIQGVETLVDNYFILYWPSSSFNYYYFELDASKDKELLDEFLIAIVLVNDSISLEKSKEKVNDMVDTIKEDSLSDLLETGKFIMYYNPLDLTLHVYRKSDYKFKDLNKDDYTKIDYEAAKDKEKNKGTMFYLKGKVEAEEKNTDLYYVCVLAEDGNRYKIHTGYAYNIKIGKNYEFYGELTDWGTSEIPCLSCTYVIPK